MNIKNILKDAIIVYVAYKLGEHIGRKNSYMQPMLQGEYNYHDEEYYEVEDITESEVIKKTDDEETYVSGIIKELKNKTNKNQKDRDKISLLEIKLNQLKNKK